MSLAVESPPPPPTGADAPPRRRRPARPGVALLAHGEPMVWLTGGALAVCLAMILSLLAYVLVMGTATFWPMPLVRVELADGSVRMGEVRRSQTFQPTQRDLAILPPEHLERAKQHLDQTDGQAVRRLLRTGNFELTNEHFLWISDYQVLAETRPRWAMVVERLEWGRFYGKPIRYERDGQALVDTEGLEGDALLDALRQIQQLYRRHHPQVIAQRDELRHLEQHVIGDLSRRQEQARLRIRQAALNYGEGSPQHQQAAADFEAVRQAVESQFAELRGRIADLRAHSRRDAIIMAVDDGRTTPIFLADVVRLYRPNDLSLPDKLRLYASRWWEYLSAEPREANSEGGVYPAIFGTVVMTLIMTIFVVPFGVLAALYLREYAKAGTMVSAVRISINNLAGVPSIVFGVFGLGFFCYIVGAGVDQLFFEARLPNPTYGKGGLLWASLTLALLTLPVVIVATEEALAAVPNSMREGSYACGAGKWQTIRRIVLPRALPGIMTGAILAMARGAGEVAPLMLVGAVKLAPELPIDSTAPYLHPHRSFMHLGFHIYDLGFQSQNSEAARPMVFTTTLLLIAIVAILNITAIVLRGRLRRRFVGSAF
jgi:phosphate transport system permease protein